MIFPERYDDLCNGPEETLTEITYHSLLTKFLQWDRQQTHDNDSEENFCLSLPPEEQQSHTEYFDEAFVVSSPCQSAINASEWLECFQELESMNNEEPAAETQPAIRQLDLSTSRQEDLVSRQAEGCRENPIDLTTEESVDTANDHVRLRRSRDRGGYIDFTRDKDVLEEQLKEKQRQLEDPTMSARERQGIIKDIEQLEAILGQPYRRTHPKRRRDRKISIRLNGLRLTYLVKRKSASE
ncbi:hypothetical protein DTO063F5_3809 [Paecilomyces variotii]|nr:hypothetical protein DTO063F5_3809 [Paecilomyces variotii]